MTTKEGGRKGGAGGWVSWVDPHIFSVMMGAGSDGWKGGRGRTYVRALIAF
jgi:hypothetical protein